MGPRHFCIFAVIGVLSGLLGCPALNPTLSETVLLAVVSTSPPPLGADVATDAAITVTFSEDLDPHSVVNPDTNSSTNAILVKGLHGTDVAGTVTYNPSTFTVTFIPSSELSPGLTYTVIVRDVRNHLGEALLEPYEWSFTTASDPAQLTVVSTDPLPNATDVARNIAVAVTFNVALDPDSVVNPTTNSSTGAVILKSASGANVIGTLTYNPSTFTVTFIPSSELSPGLTYTVIVKDVRNRSGEALIEPYEWSFTTAQTSEADNLVVVSTDPPLNATAVARDIAVAITFNVAIDPDSVVNPTTNSSTGAVILKSASGANVGGTLTYNPSTFTVLFVPTSYLAANLTYIVIVKDVRNQNGQALREPFTWTFTTGLNPGTPPKILSTTPPSDATNVARDTLIRAVFNEPISGLGNSTFFVRDTVTNTTVTARSIVFDSGSLIATFRLVNMLNPNTIYTVTVQDVTGLAGNPMPLYTWSFTTGSNPITIPTLVSTTPAVGAASVPRNTRIEAVFNEAVNGVTASNGFTLRNTLTNALVSAESTSFSNTTLTAVFIPASYLAANTSYTATLRGITSVESIPMSETSWSFTTGVGPDNVVPTITAAGLAVRANCSSEVTLTWSPASDDVTPQSGISYQIFVSPFSSGYDLNVPTYTTPAGVTTYRVTGLNRGTTYFFTVRAVDGSANRSSSFTERSATTSSYFRCPTTISVAGGPTAITVADFNGDAKLDLAVACLNTNVVAILLGNGNGTFSPATPSTVTVGTHPVDVKAADFTNDGRLDLVIANRDGGTVSILPGNGNGTFGAAVNTTLAGPLSLAVGEFNNPANANRDLAVATGDDVSVLSGNGNGTFSATITRLTVAGAVDSRSVVTGDFDGDALLDVGVCYPGTDNAGVFLNSTPAAGALAFTAPTTATNRLFSVQNAPAALAAPDLDGDGRPDLAVANTATPSVTIRQSSAQSANLFPAGENAALPAGSQPIAIAAGDIDGDGLPDLVTANRGPGTISVLINLGGTSILLVETQDAGSLPLAAALGDFNGDAKLDAAVVNFGDNTVSILLNAN